MTQLRAPCSVDLLGPWNWSRLKTRGKKAREDQILVQGLEFALLGTTLPTALTHSSLVVSSSTHQGFPPSLRLPQQHLPHTSSGLELGETLVSLPCHCGAGGTNNIRRSLVPPHRRLYGLGSKGLGLES